ncbi:hypothetical protein D9Q98_000343 [Chlorella vulgaris]|uniref:Mannose-P-dolichol utilization defect 1 protein homolog n=1 Tax=Chlorella vulgaris TaxID=3077 RepID=A0A9D4TY36_CHLVU|nr:hypothetical protein D9Q98_000343 [Chlorella vulgaris]
MASGSCTQPKLTAARLRRSTAVVCAAAAAAAAVAPAAAQASPFASASAVAVGWLVIAGSCIRSLPQILRILKNKSVQGLSLTSFSSELFCYAVSVAYNLRNGYAFSTFGDTAICAVQNVAIIGLIFRLGSVPASLKLGLSAAFAAFGWWLFCGACPASVLTTLQASSVVLLAVGGRVPQILLNLRRGDSGELSLLSCALSLVGNLARVFTTAVLVRDPIILASAGTQAVLNGILTWQTISTARRLGANPGTPPAVQPAT